RSRIALGAFIGAVLCGAALYGSSLWRHQQAPPALVVAAPVAAAPVAEPLPAPAAPVAAAPAAAAPAAAAPVAAAQPSRARVEVRIDIKATVTLDGAPITVGKWIDVDPAGRHVLAVVRAGHRPRTLELPRLEPGQTFVVGLWLRDLPEAPADATAADGEGQ